MSHTLKFLVYTTKTFNYHQTYLWALSFCLKNYIFFALRVAHILKCLIFTTKTFICVKHICEFQVSVLKLRFYLHKECRIYWFFLYSSQKLSYISKHIWEFQTSALKLSFFLCNEWHIYWNFFYLPRKLSNISKQIYEFTSFY